MIGRVPKTRGIYEEIRGLCGPDLVVNGQRVELKQPTVVGLLSSVYNMCTAHCALSSVVMDIGFAKLSTGRQLYNKTGFLQYIHEPERTWKIVGPNCNPSHFQSKSYPRRRRASLSTASR